MQDNHINMLWSYEDGGYTADILDLNACSAFGVTPREALDALETARRLGRRGTRRGQADPTASVPSHRLRNGEVAPADLVTTLGLLLNLADQESATAEGPTRTEGCTLLGALTSPLLLNEPAACP